MTHRPLTPKQAAFVAAFAGNAAEAAARAGYSGTPGSLRTIGSRLMADPRVAAALEDRRRADLRDDEDEMETEEADAEGRVASAVTDGASRGRSPREVLEALAYSTQERGSVRSRAAELLMRADRELERETEPERPELLDRINAAIKHLRDRERETGECSRCHRPLPLPGREEIDR